MPQGSGEADTYEGHAIKAKAMIGWERGAPMRRSPLRF